MVLSQVDDNVIKRTAGGFHVFWQLRRNGEDSVPSSDVGTDDWLLAVQQ